METTPSEGLPKTRAKAYRGFLSHPSPLLLIAGLAIPGVSRLFAGPLTWIDLAIAAGLVLVWPVYEWLIHVFLLHFRPRKIGKRTFDLKVAAIHRHHHREPWDLPVSFVPLHVFPLSIPGIVLPFFVMPIPYALTLLTTYAALSLHYEWCHYLAHIHWCPNNAYYKRRVKKHRLHHFQNERLWWGVSTGWGDTLLGTDPEAKDANKSPTTHDLLGWKPKRSAPSD